MDLVNPTAETLGWRYNRILYELEPKEFKNVPDEVGNHLLTHLRPRGLMPVKFGDNMDQISLEGCSKALEFHSKQVFLHDRQNKEQEERQSRPVEESPAVKQAKLLIPVYKKHVDELRTKLGVDEDAAFTDAATKALEETPTPSVPSLEDMGKEQLVKMANGLGIACDPRWNRTTLRARIREAQEAKTEVA